MNIGQASVLTRDRKINQQTITKITIKHHSNKTPQNWLLNIEILQTPDKDYKSP